MHETAESAVQKYEKKQLEEDAKKIASEKADEEHEAENKR